MLLGWLCDPFLHMLAIGAIVVVIGSTMTSGLANSEAYVDTVCERCNRAHELNESCPRLTATEGYALRQH